MFIDASAIVAILGREPGHEEIEKLLVLVEGRFFVSPLVKFEASVALARQKAPAKGMAKPSPALLRQAQQAVDAFVESLDAEEIAIPSKIGQRALDASATYGKVSATAPTSISATALPTLAPRNWAPRSLTKAKTSRILMWLSRHDECGQIGVAIANRARPDGTEAPRLRRERRQGDDMRRRTLISGMAAVAAAPLILRTATAASASIVEKFAQTLSAHDIEAFAALFAEAYVNHQSSAAAHPPAGVSAKAATVAFFAARLKGLPDLKVAIQASLAEGDKEAASFLYEGTQQGPLYGVAPTGKHLSFTSCDIFRVADGRIAEHWGMGDIAGVMAQLKG